MISVYLDMGEGFVRELKGLRYVRSSSLAIVPAHILFCVSGQHYPKNLVILTTRNVASSDTAFHDWSMVGRLQYLPYVLVVRVRPEHLNIER